MLTVLSLTIRDIQFTTDTSGDSPLVGSYVSVVGKVSGIFPELRGFFIQDGQCAWCGIFVYAGSSMPTLNLWDSVEVSGVVREYRKTTEIILSSITILGAGSPINPITVSIPEIAESLEGVLVKIIGKVVDHWINRYGDFVLYGGGSKINVLNFSRFNYLAFLGDSIGISGPIRQDFSVYEILPRMDSDIFGYKLMKYSAYFNRPTDTTVSLYLKNPGNDTLRFVVANLIGKSRYNVDIAVYNLSSQVIVDSLISAKNRGVRVRVIYESGNYNTYIQQLETAGIPTYTDSNRVDYGLMHMKVLAIDNRDLDTTNDLVLLGSYNFTTFADTLQVNSLVAIRSHRVANEFLKEFNEMWGSNGDIPNPSNSKFGTQKIQNTINVIPEDSLTLWFPPADTALRAFTTFIRGTNTQIHFGINVFTNDEILYAFQDVHFSGKLVAGIFDYSDWNNPSSKSWDMRSWTPPPRIIPYLNGYTFHDKFAIGDREAVEFGSSNWSYNGFTRNDEVVVIAYSRILADQFFQYWYKRWKEADTSNPPLPIKEATNNFSTCYYSQLYDITGRKAKIARKGIYFIRCGNVWVKYIKHRFI
ncbi:MAG: phospholipase D-like domain-containing protein [candidate division WOR-3 bacterium]